MERHTTSNHGPCASRRAVLVATGTAGLAALAGCFGDDGEVPDPISLDDEQSCEVCGMIVEMHPGPSGQAFYADEDALPAGRDVDEPAYFCSSLCAYDYVFDQKDLGFDPTVLYLTDYTAVGDDWEVYDEQGMLFITEHIEAEYFADATELTLVAGSDAYGAMGQSIVGFSDADDANAFAEEYGGHILEHDEISRELIDGLG
ncbi:nitrous oxide reductase accessory protein NosL [Natronobeatus ordinarius]|uniref:nitrous oxide reductase accessory protein NosL n=1 Tax=Natronobeatus ordinarius TaxID=2963433 RepID=UPI0020CEDE67|nr:nitrous oxide reductase accessory protein NosL [Natronobeatus ordinarius]